MPSAVPPSFGVCRTRRDRRAGGVSTAADRRCPISLALCAGAYWRPRLAPPRVRSGGSRVHSLSSSSRLAPAAGSLGRRATGTRPVHSPFFVMWPGVCRRPGGRVKRRATGRSGREARNRGNGGREGPDSAGTGVGRRPPAQPKDRAAARLDPPRVATAAAQAGRRTAGAGVPACDHATSCARWRRGWDSNPRSLSTQRFSRAPPSTARPPLQARRGYQRRARPPIRRSLADARRQRCSDETTIVPPRRSGHPRRRESMKIQMNPM